jgi:uncharacterized membrane protein YeaQ/YmgE (transglycosylase-associated protein family)
MYFDLGGLIATLIISVVAGFIASYAMGEQKNTLLTNLLLGFFGSWIATFIAAVLGIHFWGFVANIIIATLGAILLIWAWRAFIQSNAKSGRRF